MNAGYGWNNDKLYKGRIGKKTNENYEKRKKSY